MNVELITALDHGNEAEMLLALPFTLLFQLPQCELPPRTTPVSMTQPLRLPDGTEFGSLVPEECFSNPTRVTAAGVLEKEGTTRASFQSGGFTVNSVFAPRVLFAKSGFSVPTSAVERSPSGCRDLSLMPSVELPAQTNVIEVPCRSHFSTGADDHSVQCRLSIDLYVGDVHGRRERVGSVEAKTALIKVDEFSGWTQVSPFDPVPFRLHENWFWWVHTADLKGCRQPR